MPEHESLSQSKRNMRLSRIFVLLAFGSNASVNFLLIGYFARVGGIELVGHWAFLGAVMLTVMVLDFGSVNALTFRIAKDGLASVSRILRQLLRLAAMTVAALALCLAVAFQMADEIVQGSLLAGLAALLQLASNWLIAIRMGRQQIYWFNIKTIIRVTVQASVAVALLQLRLPFPEILTFGMALVLGGLAELLIAVILTFREFRLRGTGAPIASIRDLVAGFSALNIGERAYQPLSQLLTAQLLGPAAVGTFTVALRIPVVVNQALNEALRALLPGLVKLLESDDQSSAVRLLRDSVATQAILVVPTGVILYAHAPLIIDLWLGGVDQSIVSAMRLFTAALIITALGTPFHWAAQAGGEAKLLGRAGMTILVSTLTIGSGVMMISENVVLFSAVYACGQVLRAMAAIFVCSAKLNLVKPVVEDLQGLGALAHLSVSVALNILLTIVYTEISSSISLIIVIGANGFAMGLFILLGTRKRRV